MVLNRAFLCTVASEIEQEIEDKYKYVNSVTAGRTDLFTEVKEWFAEAWVKFINFIDPILLYGFGTIIVVCTVIFYCSKDNKAASKGIKYFFLYVIWCFFRGQMLCR